MAAAVYLDIISRGHLEFRLAAPFQVRRDIPQHGGWHVLEEVCKQRDNFFKG